MNTKSKQICPICETGKKSCLTDSHSSFCPYIYGLKTSTKDGEEFYCPNFKEIDRMKNG